MFSEIAEKWSPLRKKEKEEIFSLAVRLWKTAGEIQRDFPKEDFIGEARDWVAARLNQIVDELQPFFPEKRE